MNNFRVPPSPTWYTPPVSTPENGLLYIAGNHTSIAYIPPVQRTQEEDASKSTTTDAQQNSPNIQIIQTHNQFKAIDCDPNWSSTKWFVTMNEQNMIWVWNLATAKMCRGHKAHVTNSNDRQMDSDTQLGGAMCITKNRQVLSIDRNAFVRYCLVSNTFSIFPDNFVLKRGTVSLLKTSPYNQDVIAVGYKNGLIVIANYAETVVLQKLRGHDSEVVSLQWTLIKQKPYNGTESSVQSLPEPVEKRSVKAVESKPTPTKAKGKFDKTTEKKQTRREAPKPIVDAGDMFDIHSYDYLEEEFGTISNRVSYETRDDAADERKTATNNENFNFVEACQTLRDQIRAGNQSDSDDGYMDGDSNQSAVNMTDIQNMMKARSPVKDDSILLSDDSDGPAEIDELSNLSTIGSSHNTTEIVELEDVIKDLNINDDTPKESDGIVYLASGAQESSVIVWDAKNGTVAAKIQLKSEKGRAKIPKPNCTIAWIRSDEFIVNGPDGRVSTWKALDEANTNESLKFSTVSTEYPDTAVINICSNVEHNPASPIVWTLSTHLNIIGHRFSGESSEIMSKYSTLPIGMFTLRECPHDPNKIAIAGNNKRINILDLSTLTQENVEIQSLTSKIQARVLALAWHPINENLLSFGTNEGRVGTFNISKASSAPDLIKNFNGKDVYSLSYGVDETSKKCILYAPNSHKLMMFDENSIKQDHHNSLEFQVPVSSVSVNGKYIAIGLSNGTLKILSNDAEKKEVYTEVLSKKYISELSWSPINPKKLAVSTNDNSIFILEENEGVFRKSGELTGHIGGVSTVRWSGQTDHKLVSASVDHTVRVWDTQTMECIAWSEYENKMYCAAFLPTDENFVICSGQSETMHIFRIEHRLVATIGAFEKIKKKKLFNSDVQWGSLYQNEATKLRQKEKKKLRQLEKKAKDEVAEIGDGLSAVTLTPAPMKLNHTTVLHLTNKELNKEPLDHLQRLLREPSTANGEDGDKVNLLHIKLFGSREDVEQLLDEELRNHKGSKTDSIGNLLIPQIKIELKANIIESIEAKRLTEQQVSLAPSISYEFWKNCSIAYANQCIEQGFILQAIPHLLASQQVNEAIEKLCDAHFFREAWCIAKMSKEPEDNIFDTIVTKWIAHLEHLGNLEGAALISFLVGKRETSYEILNKRKFKTPQIEEILNSLSQTATK